MARVRLECPLCRAVVHDADGPPSPGRCPGCGARFAGGGERPADAAAAALAAAGLTGDADRLARALFDGTDAPAGVGITSDERDGFYAWWVFWADSGAGELAAMAAGG